MSEKEKMSQNGTEETGKETKPAKAEKTKADKPKAKSDKEKKPGFFKRLGRLLPGAEGGAEKGRLAHPQADTMKKTGVVILCVIVVGVIVWIFDGIASGVVNALLALFGG